MGSRLTIEEVNIIQLKTLERVLDSLQDMLSSVWVRIVSSLLIESGAPCGSNHID